MTVEYYLAGRCSGKTSKIIEQLQNDPSAYVIINGAQLHINEHKLADFKDRVMNASTLQNHMVALKTPMKTLLIDEYGMMSAKVKADVQRIIEKHKPNTVVVRTSHINDIDKDILAAARLINSLDAKNAELTKDVMQRFMTDEQKVTLAETLVDLIATNNTTVYSII